MTSLDWELVSSTLPHVICLVKRCYNVAATFVPNKLSETFQQCCENVVCQLGRLRLLIRVIRGYSFSSDGSLVYNFVILSVPTFVVYWYLEFMNINKQLRSPACIMCLMVHVYRWPVNPMAPWLARVRLTFLACILIEFTPQCDIWVCNINHQILGTHWSVLGAWYSLFVVINPWWDI